MTTSLEGILKSIQDFFETKAFRIGGQDITLLRVVFFFVLLIVIWQFIKLANKNIGKFLQKRGRSEESTYTFTRLVTIISWVILMNSLALTNTYG